MYYTYSHASPSGNIFYIGKGCGDRAYSFSDRSHDWKRAVKQNNGVNISILAEWDTEQEAYDHEVLLVDCLADLGFKLVNKTKGGKGVYGVSFSKERKQALKEKFTGYVHKKVTCPHCGTVGGQTTMKRWHFDRCTGAKTYKARTTVNGKRVFLGYYATKEEVAKVIENYKNQIAKVIL